MRKLQYKNGRLAIYLVLLAMVLTALFFARTCTSPTWHISNSRAGGDTLNVAIEISPLGISTRSDTLSGFYYDMVRDIAKRHNRPVKIDGFTHIENALTDLANHRYDIVVGDVAINSNLKERFITTIPTLIDHQVLVQLRDSSGNLRYPTQLSITGDTIHVPRNSPFKTRLEHLTGELGDTIYIAENEDYGSEQLILLVAIGKLPNAVVNSRLAQIMARDYPLLDSSVEISFNQFQAWILNKSDSTLRDSLNVWITDFSSTPEFKRLNRRYL